MIGFSEALDAAIAGTVGITSVLLQAGGDSFGDGNEVDTAPASVCLTDPMTVKGGEDRRSGTDRPTPLPSFRSDSRPASA